MPEDNLAGWWYNKATKQLIDVRSDMGGGTNDHVGFVFASEGDNWKKLGITKQDAELLKKCYEQLLGFNFDGSEHTPDPEFNDVEIMAKICEKLYTRNVKVLLYGSARNVKSIHFSIASQVDFSYIFPIIKKIEALGFIPYPQTELGVELYDQGMYVGVRWELAQYARSFGELSKIKRTMASAKALGITKGEAALLKKSNEQLLKKVRRGSPLLKRAKSLDETLQEIYQHHRQEAERLSGEFKQHIETCPTCSKETHELCEVGADNLQAASDNILNRYSREEYARKQFKKFDQLHDGPKQ